MDNVPTAIRKGGRLRDSEPGDFDQRAGTALVIGGSGGIGRAIALMLARRGSHVAITYSQNANAAADVLAGVTAAGGTGIARQIRLEDAYAAERLVNDTARECGGIHTLVHSAGPHVPQRYLSSVEPGLFQSHLLSEVAAFFNVVHPSITHLRRSAGSIVVVTTAATSRFPVRDGLSSGPKGAIDQLVRALAAEEGKFGVRANIVGPGMLTDGMAQRLMSSGDIDERARAVAKQSAALRRFGTATDIAEAVCFLASDRANFITGQKLDVDGGFSL